MNEEHQEFLGTTKASVLACLGFMISAIGTLLAIMSAFPFVILPILGTVMIYLAIQIYPYHAHYCVRIQPCSSGRPRHVDGVDLSTAVRVVGPLAIADACEVIRRAAIGLQHASEHGLVHRDIKPSNHMLTKSGHVKILDLGLALLEE